MGRTRPLTDQRLTPGGPDEHGPIAPFRTDGTHSIAGRSKGAFGPEPTIKGQDGPRGFIDLDRQAQRYGRSEPARDRMERPSSLREIVLHVLAETATHAGHLDAARELIDGKLHLVLE
jgi:hypothetical protein